jgi:hypothetical protein
VCVPVVRETPCEGGNRVNYGGEVLKSREPHGPLEAVVRTNVFGNICIAVGLVGGGNRGVSTFRSMVVGATSGDVGPLAGSDVAPVPHPRAGDARVWCVDPRVRGAFLTQAVVLVFTPALGHRAVVVLLRRSLSPGLQGIPRVETLEAHAPILDNMCPVFGVHCCHKRAVGMVVIKAVLDEAIPVIAGGLLTYPVVGADQRVPVGEVYSPGDSTGCGPTCGAVGGRGQVLRAVVVCQNRGPS